MSRAFARKTLAVAIWVLAAQFGAPRAAMGAGGDPPCRTLTEPQISEVGAPVQALLQSEQKSFDMPSAGVAVFDCTGMRWVGASGFEDKAELIPAGADTVFRAGALTDALAVLVMMRFAERGLIDLDAPVRRYVAGFAPKQSPRTPMTLRMLASHAAGLARDHPLGPQLTGAGAAALARVLEVVAGKSFAEIVREELFTPLRMSSSRVQAGESSRALAHAEMASYGAPRIDAPAPDPGSQPATALSTTLRDMSSLGSSLIARGTRPTLGWAESTLGGHRVTRLDGAVSGFVASFELLPDDGIGAIAYGTLDFSSAARRIADYALQAALAAREGAGPPPNPSSRPLTAEEARPLVGEYRHGRASVMVRWMGEGAFIESPRLAGRLRRAASDFVMDDYLVGMSLSIDPDGRWLEADGIRYTRAAGRKPPAAPREIEELIGDYGEEHSGIRVFERDGALFVRTAGFAYDRMTRITRDTWQFPPGSPLHPGERLQFTRDSRGLGAGVVLAGGVFPRRNIIIDPPAGKLSEEDRARLRRSALAASPPAESEPHKPADLVSVTTIDPSLTLDVRYATSRNLLGFPVYPKSAAYLQRPAAEALALADRKLHAEGFGIVVFDAYRPWYVTKMFWDGTPQAAHVFVADPSAGSRHNRGQAVDISLVDLGTGQEVEMTGAYDEFSPRSYPLYDGGTSQQRWRRDVLRAALEAEGFSVYPFEWWHFDYADWRNYGLLNVDFDRLPP